MRRACADTHALIWYLSAPRRLGKGALRYFRDAETGRAEVLVPVCVLIEISLLREAGRRIVSLADVQAAFRLVPELRVQPLDQAQALEFPLLTGIPELFDRMLVAAARVADAPLLTADQVIVESDLVTVVWD